MVMRLKGVLMVVRIVGRGWEHYIVRSVDRRVISFRGQPGQMEIASHFETIIQVSSIITVSEQQPVGHLLVIVTGCRLMVESLLWEIPECREEQAS